MKDKYRLTDNDRLMPKFGIKKYVKVYVVWNIVVMTLLVWPLSMLKAT